MHHEIKSKKNGKQIIIIQTKYLFARSHAAMYPFLPCPLKIHLHLIILILYLQQLVLQYRQNYIIYSTIFHHENANQTEHGWHK
jgi:hypothetical protein